jgi:hypothetical protein
MGPQQLKHKALALELAVALPLLPLPPFREPDELREVFRILAVVMNASLLPPVRLCGTSWTRPQGGGETVSLATTLDLRLFHYSHELRCCICRNFAQNQLQPLVEPQPSQT